MGGRIKALKNDLGRGSRFVFEVPFAKVPILQRGFSLEDHSIRSENQPDSQVLMLNMPENRAVVPD